ncbi:hypothetical protein NUG10_002524 [Yersinia enterocolitica]|nr:hypothetical protein [Yersinia enterocolitica]EKN3872856.1 hypothetical protein [Yersinia enterocolitica]
MISIAVEFKPTYMPVSTIQLKQVFSGLISNGTSTKTNNKMFSSERKSVVIHGVSHDNARSEEAIIHFNFPKIEEAFDCEFVAMPDDIKSEKDFHLWLMGMKFE